LEGGIMAVVVGITVTMVEYISSGMGLVDTMMLKRGQSYHQ
jgi:hypothetical protein